MAPLIFHQLSFSFRFLSPCSSLLALCYLITLSARANTFGGIVTPICFAVLRFMISSNLSIVSTRRSYGWAPVMTF